MATIKAIEGRSVHQIQSGQVIVDLCSVVKELVENSLDAGTSSIEVRFKNYGLESIEVQDNGKGIPSDDYKTLALKHYTSKLSNYEDLTSLETFGFRGEALSSLCALSRFKVLTARVEDGAVGKKLEFEVSGKLKGTSVVAAPKGTTIIIEDLFSTLPVRRKELEKNIKREYGKAINLLHAYACISVGVRYSVSNQVQKGKKVAVFSTKSNTTTKENIVNVYGAKTLLALVRLDLRLEMQPSDGPSTQSVRNWSTQATDHSKEVRVEGHISKPVFGEGRQAPDRQMFFVNSRPCGLPQVSKAFNEVYKSFNVSQSPFIFANLIMDTNAYDVNVSPDKRNIMLHDQTALLDSLKSALTELFEQTDHTVPQSTLPNRKLPSYQPPTLPKRTSMDANEDKDEDDKSEFEAEAAEPAPQRRQSRMSATPVNLIESWAGRDSEMRKAKPATTSNRSAPRDKPKPLDPPRTISHRASGARSVPIPFLEEDESDQDDKMHDAADTSLGEAEDEEQAAAEPASALEGNALDPMSTPCDDLFSQRPPLAPPREVQDFNALMERKRPATQDQVPEVDAQQPESDHDEEPSEQEAESQIPAMAPGSQKSTPGPVPNAFDRMRPKRTPLQTAKITVGNQTTTTVIGSSSAYKKRRVHDPVNSQAIAAFGCSPLLARGLRNFAAPGTQMDVDSSEVPAQTARPEEATDDEAEDEDQEEDKIEQADASQGEVMTEADPEDEQDSGPLSPGRKRQNDAVSSDALTSDTLGDKLLAPANDDEDDEDYMDENEKKIREDEKIAQMIQEAEMAAAQPSSQTLQRASQVLKNPGNRKESTLQLARTLSVPMEQIKTQAALLTKETRRLDQASQQASEGTLVKDELDATQAESKLSLTVSKPDFARMHIIGQFNLGFILAVRPATTSNDEDELFIIDQHAADEKYNYERFQRTVTLQSQRLVRPKNLDLTAVEEELALTHAEALKANGFEIATTSADYGEAEERTSRLLTLPISHTTTFDLTDLSELLYLLSETPTTTTGARIPRPKKVQRMLAMRACRSSIMVGKSLTMGSMERVVRHMGEMEKPWNCPHGRPTMRHLAGLGEWRGWREGNGAGGDEEGVIRGGRTDWKTWLQGRR